jgi:uncharacterized phosphosugar-binding protein
MATQQAGVATAQHFERYLEEVQRRLCEVGDRNAGAICAAADLIAEAIAAGRVLYVFGASHAGILTQDLFYRAGGLVPIEPIMPAGLMLNERPITRTSHLERLPGFADLVLRDVPIGEGDVLLVASVSGRNAVAVELCTGAQERGARVIALTSVAYSRTVAARGAARLFEVADIVIDLPGVPGDAAVELDGLDQKVGPTSTPVGTAILQGLMVEVSGRLLERGIEPPVLVSANLDGSDARNQVLLDRYRDRLSYI